MADTERNEERNEQAATSRRKLLRLGAVAVPAIVTMKPSAALASSVMCHIDVPHSTQGGAVSKDGLAVPAGTKDSFPAVKMSRDEIMRLNSHSSDPATQARLKYITNLQRTEPGFSCFASIAAKGPFA